MFNFKKKQPFEGSEIFVICVSFPILQSIVKNYLKIEKTINIQSCLLGT